MARVGTWKDLLRRWADAAAASVLPGGWRLASILATVDGYLYPHEAAFLFRLARDLPAEGPIVEIGSYRGRSTLCLARGAALRGGRSVFAVDPHVYGTADELKENVAAFGAGAHVQVVQDASVAVAERWTTRASAVFVDGDHREPAVRADVEAWLPRIAAGGILLLHDATDLGGFEGPRRVAEVRLRTGREFDAVGRTGTIAWGRIPGAGSAWTPSLPGARAFDAVLRRLKSAR